MRILALCGILLLSGCSYIWPPDQGYQRPNTTAEAENNDLASCHQQAKAMIERDRQIDSDINSVGVTRDYLRSDETLETNLSQYRDTNRYDEIVLDCMAARGYGAETP